MTVCLHVTNFNRLYVAEADKTLVLPSRASSQPTVKPNICLPPVTTLEESLWPKTKRGTFLFVWVSCSAVVSSTLVMIGLVGCFSPSQAKDWSWLMDWFVQSLLGFGGWGLARREGFNIPGREGGSVRHYLPNQQLQTQLFTALFLFDKCLWSDHWALRFGSCPVLKTWKALAPVTVEVIVSLKPSPFLAVNEPQSSERS